MHLVTPFNSINHDASSKLRWSWGGEEERPPHSWRWNFIHWTRNVNHSNVNRDHCYSYIALPPYGKNLSETCQTCCFSKLGADFTPPWHLKNWVRSMQILPDIRLVWKTIESQPTNRTFNLYYYTPICQLFYCLGWYQFNIFWSNTKGELPLRAGHGF